MCSIKTPNCERKTADIHEYRYVLSPPGGGILHSPSQSAGLNWLLHWHKFVYFLFFFCDFYFLKYFYILSRLKQVSLSLELEMRYTTSLFALLVLCTSLVNVKNQQTSVAGQHTTTWCMAGPQERSRHETKALKTSQCQKDSLWRWNSMTTNCSFIFKNKKPGLVKGFS